MIAKWIVCSVPRADRGAFAAAQEAWSALSGVSGFRVQAGGFDEGPAGQACILALWASRAVYREFMERHHDPIAAGARQSATYSGIRVALHEPALSIPGEIGGLAEALAERGRSPAVLRVAEGQVRPERWEHFQAAQREIWNPGMLGSGGLLGGAFHRGAEADRSFLVATVWESAESLDRYVCECLSALRERSRVEEDISELAGYRVPLLDAWLARALAE